MGFLPYSIITTRRHGDKVSPEEFGQSDEGRWRHRDESWIVNATEVRDDGAGGERLPAAVQQVPGPYWAIVSGAGGRYNEIGELSHDECPGCWRTILKRHGIDTKEIDLAREAGVGMKKSRCF